MLLDLVLGTACGLHDGQNALKWAVAPYAKGSVLKDTHIVIEACRNTMSALVGHVGMFIVLHAQKSYDEFDPELVREF